MTELRNTLNFFEKQFYKKKAMIRLFLLSFIIRAHGAMHSQAEHPELKQLNLDKTLMATLKWSDESKNYVQMFKASREDCMYRGSFPEDEGSKILGYFFL